MTSYQAAKEKVNYSLFFTTIRFMYDHTQASWLNGWNVSSLLQKDNFFFVPAEVNKYFAYHLKIDETEFIESIIDFCVVYCYAPVLLLTFF